MRSARRTPLALWPVFTLALALSFGPDALARGPAPMAKLDFGLRQLVAVRVHHRAPPTGPLTPTPVPVSRNGSVLVDVYVNGPLRRGADLLRRAGMRVGAMSGRPPERVVEGWLPVGRLEAAAGLRATRGVTAVQGGFTNAGSVTSEGDAAHHGPQARAFGPSGSGIPIGIMSDSINQVGGGVAASQASGNLPSGAGAVQVLADLTGGSDEGRAMAEIVYDTAPEVPTFFFATGAGGSTGPIQKAANIAALAAHGARVIADDTVFLTEPMFQDGVVAQAVDQAKAAGSAYLVSAGNRARQSWEGTYTEGPSPNQNQNDFAPGGTPDLRQTLFTVPAHSAGFLVLDWAEPWGAATTDLALDVYALPDETTPAFSVDDNNLVNGIPREATGIQNNGSSAVAVSLGIRRVAGTGTPAMKWIANTTFGSFTPEHDTASAAIDPDAASARGSLTVAAVNQSDPGHDTAESFSSRGPSVTRLFSPTGVLLAQPDVRPKPDIAAADGVATSVPGFSPFFGTSAAAPSAAGVAALLLSARPSMTVDQLYALMRQQSTNIDCTAAGLPDADCGNGFVLADQKLFGLDTTPPVVSPVLSPATPDGANGWYRGNVGVSWNVADGDSPIASSSNCGPGAVVTDTTTTFTCSATSNGGTTSLPVTIKRDSSPPSAPVISGIAARAFRPSQLPPRTAIACRATDPTSGVDSCIVSGFSGGTGHHTLTATATNDAGLTSATTLGYSVVRPAAAARLRLPAHAAATTLRRSGLSFELNVTTDRTTVTGALLAGRALIGRLKKRVNHGTAHLTLRLNARGRALLARAGATLKLVLTVTGADAAATTFTRTVRAG